MKIAMRDLIFLAQIRVKREWSKDRAGGQESATYTVRVGFKIPFHTCFNVVNVMLQGDGLQERGREEENFTKWCHLNYRRTKIEHNLNLWHCSGEGQQHQVPLRTVLCASQRNRAVRAHWLLGEEGTAKPEATEDVWNGAKSNRPSTEAPRRAS